jgi:hypothetical protein
LSLSHLERTLPGLLEHRVPVRRNIDWARIERGLGTRLPSDFVELSEAYAPLIIDDFLALHMPVPGEEDKFVSVAQGILENLASLRESDMSHGHVPFPEKGGLIPWGDSDEGDMLYWRTRGDNPDEWTVVVSGAWDDWPEFPGSLTEYLAGLISGTVPAEGLPQGFPGPDPVITTD